MSMTRRHFLGGVLAVALTRPWRALLARQTPNDVTTLTGVDWSDGPDYMVELHRIGPYTKDWRVKDTAGRYPDAYVRLAYDSTHDEAIGIVSEYRLSREDVFEVPMDWEKYAPPSGPHWEAAARETAKAWADRWDDQIAHDVYGVFRHFSWETGAEYFYSGRPASR